MMMRYLPPVAHRLEAAAHVLPLLILIGLAVPRRAQELAARKLLPTGVVLLGLLAGIVAAWSARRTARLSDQLAEEQERRQTFVSAVAHELQNRITPIMAYAQVLERQREVRTPAERQAARALVEQARFLSRLVYDLLDASRIPAGRFTIQPLPVDLVEVARRVTEEMRLANKKHRLVLKAPEHLAGVWDRDRIAQAITNLISNAVKYSPEGEEVDVTISRTDGEAMVCVSDRGIGLALEDIPLLFEPYSRVYREHRARGVGLGLYITRGIVEAHGGRVWATSPGLNRGSTFCFTLPIA